MKLENFVKKNFATYIAYAISTIAVIALVRLFNVGSEFVSVYWPIAFFVVAGLDFYKSQVVEGGASEVRAYACTARTQSGRSTSISGASSVSITSAHRVVFRLPFRRTRLLKRCATSRAASVTITPTAFSATSSPRLSFSPSSSIRRSPANELVLKRTAGTFQ